MILTPDLVFYLLAALFLPVLSVELVDRLI